MIIKRISILVIMCLFVSGCGKKNTISETVSSCYMYNWCYTENGIVYQNPNGGKNRKTEYFDYETKKYYPLCGKLNCLHNANDCMAIRLSEETGIGRLGDQWYYFRSDEKLGKGLYSCDLDGGNERRIGAFTEQPGTIGLYFDETYITAVSEYEYDDQGEQINQKSTIYQMDVLDGSRKKLYQTSENVLAIYGKYENWLLYQEMGEKGCLLRMINLETNEITKPLGEDKISTNGVVSGELFIYSKQETYGQSVVAMNLKTGTSEKLMSGINAKYTINVFWEDKLKTITLTDYSRENYPYEVYVYQKNKISDLIRKGTEQSNEMVLSVKNEMVIGRKCAEGQVFDMATISLEDYLAGKTNWKILEY